MGGCASHWTDDAATEGEADACGAEFGDAAPEAKPAPASEDFSEFGRAWQVPYVFWFVGGTDPARSIRCESAHGAARCAGVCSLPRRPAPGDFPTPDASSRSTSVTSLRRQIGSASCRARVCQYV